MLPDDRDDFQCIALNLAPGNAAVRLVANLINDVRIILILLRYLCKKLLCFLLVRIRITILQNVPVDNDIHVMAGGSSYAGINNFL